jgi:hypothetical protein
MIASNNELYASAKKTAESLAAIGRSVDADNLLAALGKSIMPGEILGAIYITLKQIQKDVAANSVAEEIRQELDYLEVVLRLRPPRS